MQLPLASIFQILRPQEQDPKSLQQANEPKWAKSFYKKQQKQSSCQINFQPTSRQTELY